jgi:glycosyltransferase involved in cell wall biosynthesis
MAEALVTVVIPTYNRSGLLREAIASVLAQDVDGLEVIVSDNASTDDTPEVVAGFGDPRLRLDRLPENIGMARNQVRATTLGTGPYLAILQDDDLMMPGNLDRKVGILRERPDIAMAHSAFELRALDGRVVDPCANWDLSPTDVVRSGEEFLRRTLVGARRTHLSASVYRRDTLDAATLTPLDGESIELALSLRAALRGAVAFFADPLCVVRLHPAQNSFASQVSAMRGSEMVRTFRQAELYHLISRAFLDRYDPPGRDVLAAGSRRWVGHELRRQVVEQLPAGPAPLVALRRLREAARIEPAAVRTPKVAWVALNALLPSGGRRHLLRARRAVERMAGRSWRS